LPGQVVEFHAADGRDPRGLNGRVALPHTVHRAAAKAAPGHDHTNQAVHCYQLTLCLRKTAPAKQTETAKDLPGQLAAQTSYLQLGRCYVLTQDNVFLLECINLPQTPPYDAQIPMRSNSHHQVTRPLTVAALVLGLSRGSQAAEIPGRVVDVAGSDTIAILEAGNERCLEHGIGATPCYYRRAA